MAIKKIRLWIQATRAETIILSLCPIAIGVTLASIEVTINLPILILTFLFGIFLHLGTNLSNDYFDFLNGVDDDNRIATKSTIQKKLTSLKEIKTAYRIFFLLAFLIGLTFIFRGGIIVALLFTVPILIGYYYTGGKKPLGYIGLGEILVFLIFGPFAVLGSYFLQTVRISFVPVLLGIVPGFLATAVLVINNLRDINVDKKANKKTLSVLFGKYFTKIEYNICIFLAFLGVFLSSVLLKKGFILTSSIFIFFTPFKTLKNYKKEVILNEALQKTVLLMILYTLFFCISLKVNFF